MPDVDLRAVSLFDARAVRDALTRDIGSGYLADPEQYASLVAFKAMLTYRISVAEKDVYAMTEPYRRRVAAEKYGSSA